jgi:MFS transporter, ACS family, D-galactonate transporter
LKALRGGKIKMSQKVGKFRYWIGILFGVMMFVNYLDRVNLSAASGPLMNEFHLTSTEFGVVASAFAWVYTLLQLPTGMILDKIGVKWLARVGTFVWGISTALTAVVSGLGGIVALRMLLGLAEAPAFAAASKATGYWFPFKERALATSFFDAASKLASCIGVPFVSFVIVRWGWQTAFIITGIISLAFSLWFFVLYRDPKHHPKLSKEELAYIEAGGVQEEGAANPFEGLGYIIRQPKVWGLSIGFAAYDYCQYMFLTWMPGYLAKAMHMDILKSGLYTAIPYFFGFVFDLIVGGWLIDYMVQQGKDSTKVRKFILVLGLVLALGVVGATTTTNPTVAIFWLSIAVVGISISAPVSWSIPSLIAPKGLVGTVAGFMNFIGNIAGIAAPILTGYIYDKTGSFTNAFIAAAFILVVGIMSYVFVLGKIEQLPSSEAKDQGIAV